MEQTYQLDQKNGHLSRSELMLLLLPVAASAFVGLFQLLLPGALANLTGYSGNDVIVYWLSGAATFGYAGALSLALRQKQWSAIRLIVVAFFCDQHVGGRAQRQDELLRRLLDAARHFHVDRHDYGSPVGLQLPRSELHRGSSRDGG